MGKEPSFLGPSDGVSSWEGDGFSLASTSHPSPASPPWSQASQAPPSHSSMACCETLEKPLPLCAQSLHREYWYQSQHLVKGKREPRAPSCVLRAQEGAYPWEVTEQQVREQRKQGTVGGGWGII